MASLDLAQIKELKDIMEDGFDDLVSTYIQDCEVKITDLQQAIVAAQCDRIAEIAHSIKGSSANICAENLAELCKQVEDDGRAETLENIPAIFENIQQEFQSVKSQLQSL